MAITEKVEEIIRKYRTHCLELHGTTPVEDIKLATLIGLAIAAEREASLDAIELHVDRLFGTWSATPDDVLEYIRARK